MHKWRYLIEVFKINSYLAFQFTKSRWSFQWLYWLNKYINPIILIIFMQIFGLNMSQFGIVLLKCHFAIPNSSSAINWRGVVEVEFNWVEIAPDLRAPKFAMNQFAFRLGFVPPFGRIILIHILECMSSTGHWRERIPTTRGTSNSVEFILKYYFIEATWRRCLGKKFDVDGWKSTIVKWNCACHCARSTKCGGEQQ